MLGERPTTWTSARTGPDASAAVASLVTASRRRRRTPRRSRRDPSVCSAATAVRGAPRSRSASSTRYESPRRRAIAMAIPPAPTTTASCWPGRVLVIPSGTGTTPFADRVLDEPDDPGDRRGSRPSGPAPSRRPAARTTRRSRARRASTPPARGRPTTSPPSTAPPRASSASRWRWLAAATVGSRRRARRDRERRHVLEDAGGDVGDVVEAEPFELDRRPPLRTGPSPRRAARARWRSTGRRSVR